MAGLAVDQALEQKTTELKTAISRLCTLQAHDAMVILRISLSTPKLMYTLRTASCHGSAHLKEFDNTLKDGLSSILNINLSEDQWNQASLPVRDGGLGIRSAASLATSAFLASAARTNDLQSRILPNTVLHIQEQVIDHARQQWEIQSGSYAPDNNEKQSEGLGFKMYCSYQK